MFIEKCHRTHFVIFCTIARTMNSDLVYQARTVYRWRAFSAVSRYFLSPVRLKALTRVDIPWPWPMAEYQPGGSCISKLSRAELVAQPPLSSWFSTCGVYKEIGVIIGRWSVELVMVLSCFIPTYSQVTHARKVTEVSTLKFALLLNELRGWKNISLLKVVSKTNR